MARCYYLDYISKGFLSSYDTTNTSASCAASALPPTTRRSSTPATRTTARSTRNAPSTATGDKTEQNQTEGAAALRLPLLLDSRWHFH